MKYHTPLYVVGGRQKPPRHIDSKAEWHHYEAALIARVDLPPGSVEPIMEYVSPPEVCPDDDPSIVFKSATLAESSLYVPTQTEVIVYDVADFRRTRYVSIPWFNDVHHVHPGADGTLFVANTGLDMVVQIDRDDSVSRVWNVIGKDPWDRFSPNVDYRAVLSTKPHRSHPNHVWFLDDELWVTRCNQYDVLCLTDDRPAVPISNEWIHDGLVRDGRVYFTSVHGHVIVLDAETMEPVGRYDLNAMADRDVPLGWCRGIEALGRNRVAVGFSRLRPTRWNEAVRWAKSRLGGEVLGLLPTRVMVFDLDEGAVVWEVDVEQAGLNAIFSIHQAPHENAEGAVHD